MKSKEWNLLHQQLQSNLDSKSPLSIFLEKLTWHSEAKDKSVTYLSLGRHDVIAFKFYGSKLMDGLIKILDDDTIDICCECSIHIHCDETDETFKLYQHT